MLAPVLLQTQTADIFPMMHSAPLLPLLLYIFKSHHRCMWLPWHFQLSLCALSFCSSLPDASDYINKKIALTTVLALYCCYCAGLPAALSSLAPSLDNPLRRSLSCTLSLFFCLPQVVNSEDAHRLMVCSKVSDYWNALFPCCCCQEPTHERMLILNKLIINNKRGWLEPNKITSALISDKYNLTWFWLHIWIYINWFVFYQIN